jgi:uncharacterized protein
MMIIQRDIEPIVKSARRDAPVIIITGPRQSGKTTLAKQCFADKPYVSLEIPHEKEYFENDPVAFLERFPDGAIIDEAQNCPKLFSYIQGIVDIDSRMGLYVLTGSRQFQLMAGVSQSLAGRAEILELLPFSIAESKRMGSEYKQWEESAICGGYPPVFERNRKKWLVNYIKTYIHKDILQLVNIRNYAAFADFIVLCATCTGQPMNYQKLAVSAGVNVKTVHSWLGVMEACCIIRMVRPFFHNYKKRIVRAPKLYFLDTGLLCALLKINNVDALVRSMMKGACFENLIFTEIVKAMNNLDLDGNLHYWRSDDNLEVDFLYEYNSIIIPIEIKSSLTPLSSQANAMKKWIKITTDKYQHPTIIYGGGERLSISGIVYQPWFEADGILRQRI